MMGLFHRIMKVNFDSFCQSSIQGVVKRIIVKCATIIIYVPPLPGGAPFFGSLVVNDVEKFKHSADTIIVNRYDSVLDDVDEKAHIRALIRRN